MTDPIERQRLLTRLNSLLLAGDDATAHRFWIESGLARDADARLQVGTRLDAIGARLGRPLPNAPASAKPRHDVPGADALHPPRRPEVAPAAADPRVLAAEPRFSEARAAARPLRPMPHTVDPRSPTTSGARADRLRQALDDNDTDVVLKLWQQNRGAPLPPELVGRVHAYLGHAVGGALRRAVQRGDDAAIDAAVRSAESAGVAVPLEARHAGRLAKRRGDSRRALDAALATDDRTALAELSLTGRLDELGRLLPDVERAIGRALAWPLLERAFAIDDDAAILAAYDPDLFDDDPNLPRPFRFRVELAQRRTAWLYSIRTALRERNAATLRAATADVPQGAAERLSRVEQMRINRIVRRDAAGDRLLRALRDGPDGAIVAALDGIEAAGAPLPAVLDWAAIRGVVDRLSLADAIRDAAAANPPDYGRLARLLPAARAAMAEGRHAPDGIDFAKLETDVLRAAHLARLRDAVAADDDDAIALAAVPDPYGAVDRLPPEARTRVAQALRATRHRRGGPNR